MLYNFPKIFSFLNHLLIMNIIPLQTLNSSACKNKEILLYNHRTQLSKWENLIMSQYVNTQTINLANYFDNVFHGSSFLDLGLSPGSSIIINSFISLFFNLRQFLRPSLYLLTRFWWVQSSCFVNHPSVWSLPGVSFLLDSGFAF